MTNESNGSVNDDKVCAECGQVWNPNHLRGDMKMCVVPNADGETFSLHPFHPASAGSVKADMCVVCRARTSDECERWQVERRSANDGSYNPHTFNPEFVSVKAEETEGAKEGLGVGEPVQFSVAVE